MKDNRLNTLSVLSIKSELIAKVIGLNEKVINHFPSTRNIPIDFIK